MEYKLSEILEHHEKNLANIASFPIMNTGWEKREDLVNGKVCYVRPMIGPESILDQVDLLNEGHNQLVFGATFVSTLNPSELETRILGALLHLRHASPILSCTPVRNVHDPELRSWLYIPVQNPQEAEEWARTVLHTSSGAIYSTPEAELCKLVERPLGESGLFEVHLVGPYIGEDYTLFIHTSHALLEGQAVIALMQQLLHWMMQDKRRAVESLQWDGCEVQNLAPGIVSALGGLPKHWEKDSPAFLEQIWSLGHFRKPSHSLKPQRTSIANLGKTVRAHRVLDEQTTACLLKCIKSRGLTVTQVLEAAHVVASYTHEPLSQSEMAESYVTMFPAIMSLRHARVSPYDRPDSFENLNSAFTLFFPTELVNSAPQSNLLTRILALAYSSQAQYKSFISNPLSAFVVAAQAEASPLRAPLGDDPNKYSGEITSLGVVDKKLQTVWYDKQTNKNPVISVKDIHLGLRQCGGRTIVHSWTFKGKLNLQVQASDIWDVEYLERFLDEMLTGALAICEDRIGSNP